jgi:cytochrome c peroxidase
MCGLCDCTSANLSNPLERVLHALAPATAEDYNQGGIPPYVLQLEVDANPSGKLGSYQPDGPTKTSTNAFFQPLGTNGCACVTCHQPPSGMSFSVRNVRKRLHATGGTDPIFAPVDGANCPDLVPDTATSGALYGGLKGKGKKAFKEAHSPLLTKGLIRIPLPVPANAEYTIRTVTDPTGCNYLGNNPKPFNTADDGTRIISVFRRPVISANLLNFKTKTGDCNPVDLDSPNKNGNIMWDGREPTLCTQAVDATLGHAQATVRPTPEQVAQIVDFETGIFSAQLRDKLAKRLDKDGATGGPVNMSAFAATAPEINFDLTTFTFTPFNEYDNWASVSGAGAEQRQSIARGQKIFNTRTFIISNVAGFNDVVNSNSVPGQCSTCHNVNHAGSDFLPGSQRDIGVGGHAVDFGGPPPAPDLPVFELTCTTGTLFNKATVTTNDPGMALITGKCSDIGRITVPTLRGLAAHEPYFNDGSAATLLDVVNFYDQRFKIGLSDQDKQDLVNFLNAL